MPSCRSCRQALVILVASITLGACDDPFRPGDAAGTYVLRSVRGEPVPAFFWQSDQAQMRVVADTLRLNADGTGSEVWHLEVIQPLRTTASRVEVPLRFEVQGDRLEGVYLCPPGAACLAIIEPIRGEFTGAGLRLDVAKFSAGPLLFERSER
jgi:hypothetical protein